MIEGSYDQQEGVQSVLRLKPGLIDPLVEAGFSVVCIEKKGVDGDTIDEAVFHAHNTPSQRLDDHVALMRHLRTVHHGPIFVLGGSEGGPIAIKLARQEGADGCIALVGCGDQTFKEYIWQETQACLHASPWWQALWLRAWHHVPARRHDYEKLCARMEADPDPKKWWFGQTYRYWADALSQNEKEDFLHLQCPALVVAGNKDIEEPSTTQLMEMAYAAGKDVQYLCIDGMGHKVLEEQWGVLDQIIQFIKSVEIRFLQDSS